MQNIKCCLKLFLSVMILSTVLLSGCALVPESMLPDHQIQLNIRTTAGLNPDEAGNPSPLTLKVYELNAPDSFQEIDFIPLFQKPKEVLGEDILGEQIIQLKPNSKIAVNFKVKRNTKYLGVVAAYQNIQSAEWRLLIPLDKNWGDEAKWVYANKLSIVQEN
jgi:type VI secretion system protein VasD